MAAGTRMQAPTLAAAVVVLIVGCSHQSRTAPAPASTPTRAAASERGAIPAQQTPSACTVTLPNGTGPPGEQPSPEFHANGALWTLLPPDGIDEGGQTEPDGSTNQKYPWWTVGTTGQLTIQGRRLDAPAPPLHAQVNSGTPETGFAKVTDGRFWASSISFPTDGCWQITGTAGQASLTFVVLKAHS